MYTKPTSADLIGNVIESWNRGNEGKQKLEINNYFSFDNLVTHIQLYQIDS
jgi:hypothetical protein